MRMEEAWIKYARFGRTYNADICFIVPENNKSILSKLLVCKDNLSVYCNRNRMPCKVDA